LQDDDPTGRGDESVVTDVQLDCEHEEGTVLFKKIMSFILISGARIAFMHSIAACRGIVHNINRANLFKDVICLYQDDEIVKECPIFIEFKGENALDYGGVQRDMFSGFWEEAYTKFFEGSTLLTPMVHPQVNISLFPVLGKVISHSYLVSGMLPVRIALPTLMCILKGPLTVVSDRDLTEAFLDYVTVDERHIIKTALDCKEKFSPDLQDDLLTTLGGFGCREMPTPKNLQDIVRQVAKYLFVTKPAAGIAMINSGIPTAHLEFWSNKSLQDLREIYRCLSVSRKKVLGLLTVPYFSKPQEEMVFGFLQAMIGIMSQKELRLFMRFVTGSSVCATSKIMVCFNSLDGVARRPIAHTCDSMLELPHTYINCDDLYNDFQSIFDATNEEFTWVMDAR